MKLRVFTQCLLSAIASVFLLAVHHLQQPKWPLRMTAPAWATAVFDSNQQLLDVHIAADQQWRLPYQAAELPHRYQIALLSFEDQYFFEHPGINPLAVGRAAWSNLQAGQVKSGASTITMQVARLLYGNQTRNWQQKLQETELALQLEWHFSKVQILKLYAEHAPYGGNIVGLTAASWWYFGRAPAALSWSEAALLAVLPNSPGLMHPGRRSDLLQKKRDRLLHKLHEQGQFDATELQLALLEPLPHKPIGWPALTPHLLQTLMKKSPQQALFYTDIDRQLQQQLTTVLARHARTLATAGVNNGAVLVLDHQQQKIRAYLGNMGNAAGAEVDIIQSRRSSGSILKPFLYGLMLDEGLLTPNSLLPDVPSQFGGYTPVNFDLQFRGAVPAATALALSLNVPAVRMLHQYGVGRFRQQLQAFGLSTITKGADHYGLSLILGGAEATLFELTRSYAAMARLSLDAKTHIPLMTLNYPAELPTESEVIVNNTGVAAAQTELPALVAATALTAASHSNISSTSTTATNQPLVQLPISQGAAYLTLTALLELERPESEGSWRDYVKSQKIAWKTGTSFGLRDAWAIGVNGRYSIGVWTGNADGAPAAILGGARSSGPILFDAFRLLPDAPWLAKPSLALKMQEICADDGYRKRGQCHTLQIEMPIATHLQSQQSYQRQLWLDASGSYQLPTGCAMHLPRKAHTRMILPVTMAYFYQPQHPEYLGLPPVYPGCSLFTDQPMDLLYPTKDSQIRLPLQLDGQLGHSVFRAIHRDKQVQIYWHLDDLYLGQTTVPHQMSVQTTVGRHRLVLTGSDGSRLEQEFTVLGDRPAQNCQGQACAPATASMPSPGL